MTRRSILGLLAGAVLDPDRLLWQPGKKLISIPSTVCVPQPADAVMTACMGGNTVWTLGLRTYDGRLEIGQHIRLDIAGARCVGVIEKLDYEYPITTMVVVDRQLPKRISWKEYFSPGESNPVISPLLADLIAQVKAR